MTRIALIDVNVIPMTDDGKVEGHAVLIDGPEIADVGPADHIDIPADAQIVDGHGGYLIPGLADMHTHLAFRDPDPAHLVLYLAEGVTTVRSLTGLPANAEWRDAVTKGQLLGPTILTAGNLIIDGLEGIDPDLVAAAPVFVPASREEAVEEVRRQAAGFPDLVKVYDGLPEDRYLAAIAAANEAGIYVAGHALDESELKTILTSGIDEIAHIDELNFYHWIGTPDQPDFRFDEDAIGATAKLMVDNDVAIVSNLVADEVAYHLILDAEAVFSLPEYRTVRPDLLEHWRDSGRHLSKFASQGPYRRDLEMPFFKKLLKRLHDEGVVITIGTDTSQGLEGSLVSHIHRELELLVEAGLTTFEALTAGTRNAATIVNRMGKDARFGTVEPGQRADLILLAGNPLEDVSGTRDRLGVVARGRWMPQAELDRMVDDLVASY